MDHANIDRMWAIWNSDPRNTNPSDPNWLKGPAASGEREFIMPMPGKTSWRYAPIDVNTLSLMNYTYDNLKKAPCGNPLGERLSSLGVSRPASAAAAPERNAVELVGSNDKPVPIIGRGTSTTVQLENEVRQKITRSL